MRLENKIDSIVAIVVAGSAAVVFASTYNEAWFSISDPDEAETVLVPRVILLCMIALSLGLLARSVLRSETGNFPEPVTWSDTASWGRVIATLAIIGAVALMLRPLGFLPSMTIGIAILGWVMGYRRWRPLVSVAVIAPLLAWYLIVEVAELTLPAGPLMQALGLG